GTAKFTQYAVLFDEIDIPEKIVKYFLLSLCYEHQIVSSAISIPAPVYQADELAKRGMNVYRELKNCYDELKNLIPNLPRLPIPPEEYHTLTNRLCYLGSRLESQRVTA
uniref:Piwi domain-containing protein n=1 Tax=Acrobeloides nanus TaxID=290746 RepID=A0A914CBG2_9BILA